MRFLLGAALGLCVLDSSASAADHIWSKNGIAVHVPAGKRAVARAVKAVPLEIYSPNHSKQVAVTFFDIGDGIANLGMELYKGHKEIELPLCGVLTVEEEVLWSPDSQTLAVTGSDSGITNWTKIFRLANKTPQTVSLRAVQEDMAVTYPICEGQNIEEAVCRAEKNGDQFNYATIAWADATTAVIMAEIPCSSSQGGMMCQVEGYEIDVRSGHILRRMTARELKKRWQSKLAWNLRIPDGPNLKSKTLIAAGSK